MDNLFIYSHQKVFCARQMALFFWLVHKSQTCSLILTQNWKYLFFDIQVMAWSVADKVEKKINGEIDFYF